MAAVAGVRELAAMLRISIRSRQHGRGECDDGEVSADQNRMGNPAMTCAAVLLGILWARHGK